MIDIKGLIPMRNEGWIIGFSLRAALAWMDSIIVLNHASTDNTREILEEIQGEVGRERLTVIDHPDPIWRDVNQRQQHRNPNPAPEGCLFFGGWFGFCRFFRLNNAFLLPGGE